jgi:hypothetical protein
MAQIQRSLFASFSSEKEVLDTYFNPEQSRA